MSRSARTRSLALPAASRRDMPRWYAALLRTEFEDYRDRHATTELRVAGAPVRRRSRYRGRKGDVRWRPGGGCGRKRLAQPTAGEMQEGPPRLLHRLRHDPQAAVTVRRRAWHFEGRALQDVHPPVAVPVREHDAGRLRGFAGERRTVEFLGCPQAVALQHGEASRKHQLAVPEPQSRDRKRAPGAAVPVHRDDVLVLRFRRPVGRSVRPNVVPAERLNLQRHTREVYPAPGPPVVTRGEGRAIGQTGPARGQQRLAEGPDVGGAEDG